jgi:hypothetical protein
MFVIELLGLAVTNRMKTRIIRISALDADKKIIASATANSSIDTKEQEWDNIGVE